jgi:biopolymer transport protein ExbD
MPWQIRHEGSPRALQELNGEQIVEGLRDGVFEATDEVRGPEDSQWMALENHPQFAELAWDLEQPPRRHDDDETRLDMNALIDVCLVLLIFFILTATYAAAVQKLVPLPTAQTESNKKAHTVRAEDVKKKMIRLEAFLDKAGKPVLRLENQPIQVLTEDEKSIDPYKLRQALQTFVRGAEGKSEILLDARHISWGLTIAIQDGAKAAGVQTIHHLVRK